MSHYPTIKEALDGGPGGVQGSINAALTLVTAESIGDLIASDLNNWMNDQQIPVYLRMAFRVKRLTRSFDQGSHKFFVSQLADATKLNNGNWLELIYTQVPAYFNSAHLAKYLTFAIYEELIKDLKDRHQAFKVTTLYFDEVTKEVDLLNKFLSGYPDASLIDEVMLDYETIQNAARSIIDGVIPSITPHSISYTTSGEITLS